MSRRMSEKSIGVRLSVCSLKFRSSMLRNPRYGAETEFVTIHKSHVNLQLKPEPCSYLSGLWYKLSKTS